MTTHNLPLSSVKEMHSKESINSLFYIANEFISFLELFKDEDSINKRNEVESLLNSIKLNLVQHDYMYMAVYIYGASIDIVNHGANFEEAKEQVIQNASKDFDPEEDDVLLFKVASDNAVEPTCVFKYEEYLSKENEEVE
ncbi:hypothetical protein [Bacillus cereus]|uniref:hypothetical protein n=1 Tax=Bacillus cereus TaxID=1396 RepID=UPI00032E5F25|nr:hypothetical protein [Bacillus cereus]EOO44429.1 hypothetical protein ICK_06204 [Bacillus cereus BAG1X2-2]